LAQILPCVRPSGIAFFVVLGKESGDFVRETHRLIRGIPSHADVRMRRVHAADRAARHADIIAPPALHGLSFSAAGVFAG